MAVDEDDIADLAYGIVEDFLRDGVEYIAVSEAVGDNLALDDDEDEDEITQKVYAAVEDRLTLLKERM
jgi:hypothetical protein